MSETAKKVETLIEAMPYLQKYAGKIVVIKYGGNAMINEELKNAVLHDVVLLKLLGLKPVLSHGGGPGINKMLGKLDIPVKFINGLRDTSEDIMRVVEM
ncbi:MAG: acetylglutamate kinase, partial [Desulfovibrio sp.]|nr:acetylglutamate kinase [Desulfovibrio sp.]